MGRPQKKQPLEDNNNNNNMASSERKTKPMIKKKVIDKESAQKLSFARRKETVKKRARELSILCDVPVCMISFGVDGNVETWPENSTQVMEVINKYKQHGNNKKIRGKKKQLVNRDCVVVVKDEELEKEEDMVMMAENSSERANVTTWIDQFDEWISLSDIKTSLDSQLDVLEKKIEFMRKKRIDDEKEKAEKAEKAIVVCASGEIGQSGQPLYNNDIVDHTQYLFPLVEPDFSTFGAQMDFIVQSEYGLYGDGGGNFPPTTSSFMPGFYDDGSEPPSFYDDVGSGSGSASNSMFGTLQRITGFGMSEEKFVQQPLQSYVPPLQSSMSMSMSQFGDGILYNHCGAQGSSDYDFNNGGFGANFSNCFQEKGYY